MSAEGGRISDSPVRALEEEQLFAILNGYWEELQRGTGADPRHWLTSHPLGQNGLGDFQLLDALLATRERLGDDSQVHDPEDPSNDGIAASMSQCFAPGDRVGEYQILDLLGSGGMGEVYLARHALMQRQVALKVMRLDLARQPELLQRFRDEIKALAGMKHENIVFALDAGTHNDLLYLVMEYVPGINLKRFVLEQGPLPAARASDYIQQAARGLEYAHRQGFVHRDLKPSNLLLTPGGRIKILDLGLAKAACTAMPCATLVSSPGTPLGTLNFMAPEQLGDASRADERSDLYSLGCTFYYLLAGCAPFHAGSAKERLRMRSQPLSQVRPDVPWAVADIIEKLLAEEPDDRHPSARAFIQSLDAAMGHRPIWKWLLGLAAGVVVALGITAFFMFSSRSQGPIVLDELAIHFWKGLPDQPRVFTEQSLVVGGKDRNLKLPRAWRFGTEDGLQLRGHFNRPTYWYCLWIDTRGLVTLTHPHEPETNLVYPIDQDRVVRPNPTDPKGVHLLLLVTGVVPPKQGQTLLKAQLQGIGPPPSVEWAGMLRGPEEVALAADLPRDYLRGIYGRIPDGLQPVYALFIGTDR